jgi:hypothetical protein
MNELRRRTTADTFAARDVDTIFINQHLLDTVKPRGKYSGIHKKIRFFSRICGYKPVNSKPMEKWKSPAKGSGTFPLSHRLW